MIALKPVDPLNVIGPLASGECHGLLVACLCGTCAHDDQQRDALQREDEQSAEYVLCDLADGRDLACDDLHTHRARYDEIVGQSAYKDMRA